MMLGLWAGRWLMTSRSHIEKLKGLVIAGVALTLAGLILQWLHINPIIKRIWTSSYTLYSGGLVILMLAGFYALIELKGWKRWAFPLLVIGANSIAVYVMSWTIESFVSSALVRHLGTRPISGVRAALRAGLARVRGAGGVLVDPAVDVPAQDFPAHLTSIRRRFGGSADLAEHAVVVRGLSGSSGAWHP